MKEIEFDCPNCQQTFKSVTYTDGAECVCSKCNFSFTILAKPPEANSQAERLSAPESHSESPGALAKAAAILTRPIGRRDERTDVEKLFDDASGTDSFANILLVVSAIAFVCAFLGGGTAAGAVCGGFLSVGLAFKIIAQLIFIRAEIRSKK
jgi:hypothetical protein